MSFCLKKSQSNFAYGETQQEFADRLGVNVNMVRRWENGAKPMRAHVLKALLDAEAQAPAVGDGP